LTYAVLLIPAIGLFSLARRFKEKTSKKLAKVIAIVSGENVLGIEFENNEMMLVKTSREYCGSTYLLIESTRIPLRSLKPEELGEFSRTLADTLSDTGLTFSIHIYRKPMNIERFVKSLERSIANARIEAEINPFNKAVERRIRLLEEMYGKVLKGGKPYEAWVVIGVHECGRREEVVQRLKSEAKTLSTTLATLGFKATLLKGGRLKELYMFLTGLGGSIGSGETSFGEELRIITPYAFLEKDNSPHFNAALLKHPLNIICAPPDITVNKKAVSGAIFGIFEKIY